MYKEAIIQIMRAKASHKWSQTFQLPPTHTCFASATLFFPHNFPTFCNHAPLFYVVLNMYVFVCLFVFCLEYPSSFLPVANSYLLILLNYYLSGSLLHQLIVCSFEASSTICISCRLFYFGTIFE